jgi:hypothetical protein
LRAAIVGVIEPRSAVPLRTIRQEIRIDECATALSITIDHEERAHGDD